MALKLDFYKEIIEREQTWLTNLEYNLLNVYYLSELKEFYTDKYNKLNEESSKKVNPLISSIINVIKNMISKLDSIINTYNEGKDVDLNILKNYFLTNMLKNEFYDKTKKSTSESRFQKISEDKDYLYDLKNKLSSIGLEDIDDDFYYHRKVG